MKKITLIFGVSLFMLSTYSIDKNVSIEKELTYEYKYRQCNATAKSTGNRCKRCVSKSTDYQCYQHKP